MVVNNAGCAASGCHPTVDAAVAAQATLQTEIEDRLEDITTRLNGFSMTYTEGGALTGAEAWEYSATGGPSEADQDEMPDNIKKIRFLLKYVEGDGSLGIHNPDYVRRMQNDVAGAKSDSEIRAAFDEFHESAVFISKVNLALVSFTLIGLAWSGPLRETITTDGPTGTTDVPVTNNPTYNPT